MLKKLAPFLLFLGCLLVANLQTSPVSALEAGDVVIQLEPAEQDIALNPGKTFSGIFKVQNVGRLGFDFTLSTRPFQVLNDEYEPDFSTENNYTLLKNWISFPEESYHLEPGAEVEVSYLVDVPLDVPAGGQYAAIVVETRDTIDESSFFHTIGQVATILYGEVAGESRHVGELTDHHLPKILFGQPLSASMTVKNSGNTDFRVTHQLSVYDFFTGNEAFSAETVDADGKKLGTATPRVMPGNERSNILTWTGAPKLGVFKVVQTVSFLDQNYTFEQIVVLCPIWLVGGVVFLIILMIVWLILRARSRKRGRPQAF